MIWNICIESCIEGFHSFCLTGMTRPKLSAVLSSVLLTDVLLNECVIQTEISASLQSAICDVTEPESLPTDVRPSMQHTMLMNGGWSCWDSTMTKWAVWTFLGELYLFMSKCVCILCVWHHRFGHLREIQTSSAQSLSTGAEHVVAGNIWYKRQHSGHLIQRSRWRFTAMETHMVL